MKIKNLSCENCSRRVVCIIVKLCGLLHGVCENYKEDKKQLPKSKNTTGIENVLIKDKSKRATT